MQAQCTNHRNEHRQKCLGTVLLLTVPYSFSIAKDHCSFDLQQIGRSVANHTDVTLAFIYLHMQACIWNVFNLSADPESIQLTHLTGKNI